MATNQQQQTTDEQEEEQLQEQEHQEAPSESGVSDSGQEKSPDEMTDEELFAALDEEPHPVDDEEQEEPEQPPEGGQEPPDPEEGDEPQHGRPKGAQGGEEAPEKPERPPEEQSKEPEWFQKLPEEGKKTFQQLNDYSHKLYQSYAAVYGRLAPIQRENADLKERLRQQEQAAPPTLDDLENDDAYKEIAEEFPEEAKGLKKFFASKQQELEKAQQQAAQTQQALDQAERERIQRETARLESVHPDWMQTFNSPPFQHWKSVVLANPYQYPDLAQKLNSPWAEDNAEVLDTFKQHAIEAGILQSEEQGKQEQPPQQARQSTAGSQQRPSKPQRPRPPQPSPPSQGSGVSGNRGGGIPLSEEEEFHRLVQQDET